jgi:type II secretory pathway component PulF
LAILLKSGITVDLSLNLLRDQAVKSYHRRVIGDIVISLHSGYSLAAAFNGNDAFLSYVTGVIRAFERVGDLGDLLSELAERLAVTSATRRQLITAMTYPAAILAVTCAPGM